MTTLFTALTYIATLEISEIGWEPENETVVPILLRSTLVSRRNLKIPLIVPNGLPKRLLNEELLTCQAYIPADHKISL